MEPPILNNLVQDLNGICEVCGLFFSTGKNQDKKACLLVAYFRKESEELWVGVAGLKHFVESWEAL